MKHLHLHLLFTLLASLLLGMLFSPGGFADAGRWSKVRIQVPERETLHKMIRLGVNLEGSRGKEGGPMECIVSEDVLKRLEDEGLSVEVLIPDLAAFYESRLTPGPVNAMGFGYGTMGGYYTYDEIRRQLDTLRLLYPQIVGVRDSIGATLQGRPIWAVRMTANPDLPSARPQVLFFAMQHAREPIGMMVLLYTMWQLAEGYGVDPEKTYLLDNRDLWFVPIVNPDGYEANHRARPNGGGLRRKNMRDVVADADDPRGVDLNRNWGAEWGMDNVGSSPSQTYEDYRGTGPFSEPETQVMRDFCNSKAFRFVMEYHAYWNTVFSPPSYDMTIETADSLLFRSYLRELTRLNHYSNGMCPSSYPVNGGGSDWLYENPHPGEKSFPFLVEVGNDLDGFWPATSRILPLVTENLGANLFAAWAGGECPRVQQTILTDSSGDGDLSPGEPFELRITLHNFGADVATLTSVRVGSTGRYVGFPNPLFDVAGLAPHADTTVAIAGRVAPDAVGGVEEGVIVSVSPAPQVELFDTVSVILGTSEILFSDGAETGTTNWRRQGTWGRTNVAHGGSWSFTDSPNSDYGNSSVSGMTLASPITLPVTGQVVRLRFWAKWSTEPGFDFGTVQASTDSGRSWSLLSGRYASKWRQEVYTGSEPRWIQEEIDLSRLAGQEVLLSFTFFADWSTTGDGIYIDDIAVKSYEATGSRLEPLHALEFAKVAVGEPDTMQLVLRNVGTSALNVTQINHTSDAFSLANAPALPHSLAGTTDSLALHVVFIPDSHGPVSDTLVISSNDPVNPVVRVPLDGFGVQLGTAVKGTMYAASSTPGNSLFTLDTQTGEVTSIGPHGGTEIQTLSIRPSTGELYGTAQIPGALQLYRLSAVHGTAVPMVSIPLAGSRAMAFSPILSGMTTPPDSTAPPDQLYVATPTGKLYNIDPASGDTTLVGIARGVNFTAMTFNPWTGDLWAASAAGAKDSILKVNPLTAEARAVGRTGDGRVKLALAFDQNKALLALMFGSPRNLLQRVDETTGAGTSLDTVSTAGIITMAMDPVVTSVSGPDAVVVPESFALGQNFPNPFNPSTTIRYDLAEAGHVVLKMYNLLGQEVRTLVDREQMAGAYSILVNAADLASGVYYYRITAGTFSSVRSLILLR